MAQDVPPEFDQFFAQLERDQMWGDITFKLAAGKVVHVSYHRDFRTLDAARDGLHVTPAIGLSRTDEETPGGRNATHLYQNGRHSPT